MQPNEDASPNDSPTAEAAITMNDGGNATPDAQAAPADEGQPERPYADGGDDAEPTTPAPEPAEPAEPDEGPAEPQWDAYAKNGCIAAGRKHEQVTFFKVDDACSCSLDLTKGVSSRDADKLKGLFQAVLMGSSIYQ